MVKTREPKHPLQSHEWAQFRQEWGNEVLETKYGVITLHKIPFTPWKIGMFIKGPKPTQEMLVFLKKIAKEIGISHITIDTSELNIKGFAENPPNRCYFCKSELFGKLKEIAKEKGYKNVVDGANLDDINEYRPGSDAAKELNVRSPLKESGLRKSDIRDMLKYLNISNWDKPSYACMSSRFPYGESISEEKLTIVAAAENYLRSLGLRQFRVRHHNTIARIEVLPEDITVLLQSARRKELVSKFKEIGYKYVTIDMEGYRSGSMNEVLKYK